MSAQPSPIPHDLGRRCLVGENIRETSGIAAKVFSTVGQVILARLLAPGDFGLLGMTWTVLALASLVQNLGVQDVLVARQDRLRRWANPAFWMALTAGVAGMIVANLASPIAVRVYGEARLVPLIAILALSLPLRAAMVLPQARLAATLRFRTDATINAAAIALQISLSILLASLGWGAYALVVPVPVTLAAQAAAMWALAPMPVRWRPQFRRWRFLVGDTGSSWIMATAVTLTLYADYAALSVFHTKDVVGLYYVAFILSTQVAQLLTERLVAVLLPSLSLLRTDAARQTRAFIEATRLLTAVALPACLLLAAGARPLVHLLYRPEYAGVAPMLAALAVGMGLYLPAGPATSMLKASRRFGTLAITYGVMAITLAVAVLTASATHSDEAAGRWVALSAGVVYSAFGPILLIVSLGARRSSWAALGRVYGASAGCGMTAVACGWLATRALPQLDSQPATDLLTLIAMSLVAGMVYLIMLRVLARGLWDSLWGRLRSSSGGWVARITHAGA